MAAKRRPTDDTPSLFDDPPVDAEAPDETPEDWQEVPAARFLSWSPRMQAAYCRDRDLNSAQHADTLRELEFYRDRAAGYAEDVKCL